MTISGGIAPAWEVQAVAKGLDGLDAHTYVMMGDGEMGEGQVWEAVASAEKYKLANLTAIVDQNGYQQTGATKDVLDLKPFAAKFEAFGWHTQVIEGNTMEAVVDALAKARTVTDGPTAIISQTKKGFGILPIIEPTGDLNYHGKPLSKEQAELFRVSSQLFREQYHQRGSSNSSTCNKRRDLAMTR